MADLSVTPVAGQIRPVPSMSLGDMLSLARGVQAYQQAEQLNPLAVKEATARTQTAEQTAESGGIALRLEQQKENERKGLQQFLAIPENYQTNGRVDLDKLNLMIPRLAPLTGPEVIKNITSLAQAQTEALKAKQGLTQEQRNMIGARLSIFARAGATDRQTYLKELDLLGRENPDNPDLQRLIESYKKTLENVQSGPLLPQLAITAANSLMNVAQQQEAFAPRAGLLDTGAQILSTATIPSVAGGLPTVQVGAPLARREIGPGQTMEPTGRVDTNNNPTAYIKDSTGRILGEVTIPVGQMPAGQPQVGQQPAGMPAPVAAPQAQQMAPPAPSPVARMRPGETPETMQQAQNIRSQASNSAAQVPNQVFNNNQIIKLADDVITGKGASFVGNLTGGYAAIPFTTDNATNLNQLGHYMALQTASLAASSGLGGTDAARGIAGEISGTTNWTAPAIKQTARVNRALATSTDLFNQGVQNAFNRSKDPFSARDFQNKWSQTVDINAIRLYDAVKNNDTEAIKEIVKSVGGKESTGYKRLKQNLTQIQSLIGQ
jgi:hypothetical protein